MTIPTREEALRALDKIHTASVWEAIATLRSYIEGHTGEPLAHEWHERFGLTCCKVCGLVRNENGDTRGCRGPVYVSLRDASPVQPVLEWHGYALIRDGEWFGRVAKCGFKHVWFTMIGDKKSGDYATIDAAKTALKSAALSKGDK